MLLISKRFLPLVSLFITIMPGIAAAGFWAPEPLASPPFQRVPAKTHVQRTHHKRLPSWVVARNKRIRQERNWAKHHKRVDRGKHTYRTPK